MRLTYGDALPSEQRSDGAVPVFGSNGQVGTHDKANMLAPAVVVGRKGSFGKVVFAEQGGFCIDTAYFVDARSSRNNMRWAFWALQTLNLDEVSEDTGVPGLSREHAHNQRLAVPPESDQGAVADYLDRETTRIDALIEKKTRFIELLREKRQALITQAVTQGLDPAVPMKDSGVEWLGQVPAHWQVWPLKYIARVQTGVAKGKDTAGRTTIEVPYLRVANVQDGYLDLNEIATIEIDADDLPRYLLQAGDVLMNEGGDFDKLGRGHVWRGEIEPCIHQNHVFAVRPTHISSDWLNAYTSSLAAQFYFMSRSKQSTNLASISSTNLMELPVPVPPASEQTQVLGNMKDGTARIDSLARTTERSLALLKERRSALITAAVTGQIDLRDAA
ncbi:restriction endonuclease subunit S [Sphaerotilaceae bacterium SBD11-9]